MSWEKHLNELKKGNERFRDQTLNHHFHSDDALLALHQKQEPLAIVLSCADSRVSPDIVFDQPLGNLFIIQNAGSVISDTVLGSIEYGLDVLNIPLIVVIGHENCGAVTSAYEGVEASGKLKAILNPIIKNIEHASSIEDAIWAHAHQTANEIQNWIHDRKSEAHVVMAYYDLEFGSMHFDF